MVTFEAPIVAVTVFTDRARITRRGVARLEPGEHTLSLAGLPTTLASDSVRVFGRGAGVRILGVDVATEFVTAPPEASIAALQQQLDALYAQDQTLLDRDQGLASRQDLLRRLGESSAAELPRGLAFGRATVETVDGLVRYLSAEQEQAAVARRTLAAERRALAREIEALRGRLAQVRPPVPEERRAIQVAVEAAEAVELSLELTYVAYGASWEPIYDLRLNDTTVAVSYLASVRQQSGEDWPAVQLSLSTARIATTTTIPELPPWFIELWRPRPQVSRAMAGMPMPAAAPKAMAEIAADESFALAEADMAPQAIISEATIESQGASVTYRVARPVAVPSDGTPHRTQVTTLDLPAALDYITAPKIAEEVYLRAKVTNTSAFTLLPGAANIFHGDAFVGTTRLETTAPSEAFELQLGIDERIKVARELASRNVAKTFIGNVRRTQVGYRIKLTALLDRPARVTVLDQLPVSRHEEVKVRLDEATPKPAEQSNLNLLRWELELPPNKPVEISFSFTVEHQRDAQVIGFNV